ncbi:VOC family protein [Tamlana fucoidanivorans]|uniref:VOC family protein n=1 Tax=Allotamlana fucoidanivorans TaxID=2583814 RepID=A0A5C4ST50_9FLAO|nr:VOC family protein [Tamlana fucoidanivorans]TNJ47187.1 VOC family protein [Tamlana fucoidanivorans]
MIININMNKKENNTSLNFIFRGCLIAMFLLTGAGYSFAQNADSKVVDEVKTQARVTGLRYICVHVLQLEKSLKLYREILGFKMSDAEVLHGQGIEGMLVMKLKTDDLTIGLSLTAPEYLHTIGPIGNTNHNHFMLKVNDIVTIGDKLKAEGYELENEHYARDKYTFFVGPNGEIIGLSAWD